MTNPEKSERVPCPACNGQGWTAEHSPGVYDHDGEGNCNGSCPVQVQCEPCMGSGKVALKFLDEISKEVK